MKKINSRHDNRDRIIFVRGLNTQKIYYQPAGSSRREWLFDTRSFNGSLDRFVCKYGTEMRKGGRFITIGQLYGIAKFERDSFNKVGKTLDRIPRMVDYVIREFFEEEKLAG